MVDFDDALFEVSPDKVSNRDIRYFEDLAFAAIGLPPCLTPLLS